jgi:hypothetical protein
MIVNITSFYLQRRAKVKQCSNTKAIIISGPRTCQVRFYYFHNTIIYCTYLNNVYIIGWYPNAAELFVADGPAIIGAEWISLGNPSGTSYTIIY